MSNVHASPDLLDTADALGLAPALGGLPARAHCVVIGGGVIGLATALELAQAGADTVVLERGRIGGGASLGNGGLVPPSHSIPLTAPGIVRKAVRWMADPASPFYVRLRADPEFIAFLLRFALASRRGRLPRAVPAMRDLNLLSAQRLSEIVETLGDVAYRRDGVINVYRSAQSWKAGLRDAAMLAEFGLRSRALGPEELHVEEPALRAPLAGGVMWPDDGAVDPERLTRALAAALAERGSPVHEGVEVHELLRSGETTTVRTSAGSIEATKVVVAAGSWTSTLARSVSRPFPLQPAKGYSVTVTDPPVTLRRPLLLSEAKVAATPFDGRLRLAGTLELVGFDLSISRRRADAVLRAGHDHLGAAAHGTRLETWSGLRALSGDGVPIIGPLPGRSSVLVATGHGHAGIGMAAGTAQLVASQVLERDPPIDPGPYAPGRFRWPV